jgi:tRNA pseudouridine55 synthase
VNGLLVIDKPAGMTSRDVVNRVQKWFPRKTKIGHTGTLDPLATGVLVLCVGSATRLADVIQAMGKTYHAIFELGVTSPTDDADGEIQPIAHPTIPTRDEIAAVLSRFVGWIEQRPPAVSALKVEGRRAHELARRGENVPLAARRVRIDAIQLRNYHWPLVEVEVDCGKGTYIRSIARDLGAALKCGGIVRQLRRMRVGPFTADAAIDLDTPPEAVRLRPIAEALQPLPAVTLPERDVTKFTHGQPLQWSGFREPHSEIGETTVAVYANNGEPLGIGILTRDRLRPSVVLPTNLP